MKCRNCGTEIADKALICYRCGTATAAPRIPPPVERRERGPLPLIIAILAIVLAAVFAVPYLPPGPTRLAGYAAVAVVTFFTVRHLRPGRTRLKR
jgi:zinc ribbon protein